MKNKKRKTISFGLRLWFYFVLFTALIFTVLWLLQTVFLQSFYDMMIKNNVRTAAGQIITSGSSEDINDIIDSISHDNTLLVFVTDTEGNVLYSSDEFKRMHNRKNDLSSVTGNNFRHEKRGEGYRELPESYYELYDDLEESENGSVEFTDENFFIYASYIDYNGSDEKSVLYISATIDAVGSSVSIISIQLVWVTILSLIAGFIISWFISGKFARPVAMLSEKAKKLGEKEYRSEPVRGFCSELDELSSTLDRTNDKLVEANNFQMELMANVSHDLRTPLTMIKGYAEMIRDISIDDREQCSSDIEVIIKETDRLTALVNEIMEYSELKTNERPEEFICSDLSRIVSGTADSFEALYKPEKIVLDRDIDRNIFIECDSTGIQRALYNLMDNAFRHTDESRRIGVSLKENGDTAVISVTDCGNGIPPEEVPHIWDRYYTSRMRNGKGVSGLGLAIVRQITDLHGGKCRVETEAGKGSTFIIEIKKIPHKDRPTA